MKEVAKECFRVLKPNHFCTILIGDTRRNLHYIPVAFRTLNSFLEVGLILREDIISAEGAGVSEFLFDPFFSLELTPADRGAKKKTVGEEIHGE